VAVIIDQSGPDTKKIPRFSNKILGLIFSMAMPDFYVVIFFRALIWLFLGNI